MLNSEPTKHLSCHFVRFHVLTMYSLSSPSPDSRHVRRPLVDPRFYQSNSQASCIFASVIIAGWRNTNRSTCRLNGLIFLTTNQPASVNSALCSHQLCLRLLLNVPAQMGREVYVDDAKAKCMLAGWIWLPSPSHKTATASLNSWCRRPTSWRCALILHHWPHSCLLLTGW